MNSNFQHGLAAACGCLWLGGCVATEQPQPYALVATYQEADFKPYGAPGPASVSGQAFLKTVGGDVKTCAGNKVGLVPATDYNTEALEHVSAATPISNEDPRAKAFSKSTVCDAEGRFEFDKVAARKWYVITNVSWGVPQVETGLFGPEVVTSQQGGFLLKQLDLKGGANQVLLTDADRVSAGSRPAN
jgi:hypothetical protein